MRTFFCAFSTAAFLSAKATTKRHKAWKNRYHLFITKTEFNDMMVMQKREQEEEVNTKWSRK